MGILHDVLNECHPSSRRSIKAVIFLALGNLLVNPSLARPTEPNHLQSQQAYSSLVIFGDSYSDNGHNASLPLQNSIYAALGDAAKGIMWPNIVVKDLSVNHPLKLYDYARNGAHANKNLLNAGYPMTDTREQMMNYFSDLKIGNVTPAGGPAWFVLWIGINPLKELWLQACDPKLNDGHGTEDASDPRFLNATVKVVEQIEEVHYQVKRLRDHLDHDKSTYTITVVTVPDFTIAPLMSEYISNWTKGDTKRGHAILNLQTLLIDQYNTGLHTLPTLVEPLIGSKQGQIDIYDVNTIWNSVVKDPKQYGIKDVYDKCYDDDLKTLCSDVDTHFFYDPLHPSPHMEKIIGHDISKFLMTQ